jgi:hypothetical protein
MAVPAKVTTQACVGTRNRLLMNASDIFVGKGASIISGCCDSPILADGGNPVKDLGRQVACRGRLLSGPTPYR